MTFINKQMDAQLSLTGPLSVTFSSIFMVKMENDIVIPTKSVFYCRYEDM